MNPFGFGSWSVQPNRMWEVREARLLHRDFHEKEDTPDLYKTAVQSLRSLPLDSASKWRLAREAIWGFLIKWGRIRGFREANSYGMLKKLDSNALLINSLRKYELADDLARNISFKGQSRTIASWMQSLLCEISSVYPKRHQVVGASKLLHVTIPKLFVMFDNPMCERFFGTGATVPVYCGLMLPLARTQIEILRSVGVKPASHEACNGSWAKLVDEINWAWANRHSI